MIGSRIAPTKLAEALTGCGHAVHGSIKELHCPRDARMHRDGTNQKPRQFVGHGPGTRPERWQQVLDRSVGIEFVSDNHPLERHA